MTPNPEFSFVGQLLVVDDEENILHAVCRVMQPGGWIVHTAPGGEEGLEIFREVRPQVVISDYRMIGMDGVEFLSQVHKIDPKAQCIVLTSLLEQLTLKNVVSETLALRFVFKPWNEAQFFLTVQSAFRQYELEKENEHLYGLTHLQNAELRSVNAMLEQKIFERTQQLSVAKHEWERSFDSIKTPLALVDTDDLRLRRINRAYARLAQRSVGEVAARQRCFIFLFGKDAPCDNCPLPQNKQSLSLGQTLQADIRQGDKIINLSVYSMDKGKVAVCSYRDVSEERAMYSRLAETEKMVAVGHLARGVAHEINNPLSGILAFAQLMKREKGRSPKDLELFGVIEKSSLRCKRIVESLLEVGRKPRQEDRRLVDFGHCVEDAVVLFRAQIINFPKVVVDFSVEPQLPQVYGDFGQIGQVVLSLLQNGLYTFKDNVGILNVRVGQRDNHCFFSVSDNGAGIAEEHLPHIFEPHFTTKPVGQGTGLGLSIAYQIVSEHGGKFEVKTKIGKGTTFSVFFPTQFEGSEAR